MSILRKIYNRITGASDVYIDDYKRRIKPYLPNNPVILEAGASDGRDTLQMITFWPKASIHAFEPIPELLDRVKTRVGANRNIRLYPFALSEISGKSKIHVSSGLSDGSSSLLAPLKHLEVHPDVKFEETLEIDAFTIDDWASKNGVTKIDFMWLDLQGMEYNVLNASPNIFSTVKVLFTEVSLIETYKGVKLYPEFRKWLELQGFQVIYEDLPYKDMGNVLFVRK